MVNLQVVSSRVGERATSKKKLRKEEIMAKTPINNRADKLCLILIHIILIVFLAYSIWKDIPYRQQLTKKVGNGFSASATVTLAEKNMNAIYVAYGIATIAMALAVQVAETAKGYKSVLIIIDYGILTYLFFFNLWFKDALLIEFGKIITW